MAEPAKIPERHVFLTPGRMKIGESACFEAEAMRVDIERYCYIDPYMKRSPEAWEKLTTKSTRDHILLERVEGGFRVDLTKCREPWPPSGKPEPKYGTDWIPVVEFVTDAGQPRGVSPMNDQAMSEALGTIHDEAIKLLKLDPSPEAEKIIHLIISIARHKHDVRTHEERGRSAPPGEAPGG